MLNRMESTRTEPLALRALAGRTALVTGSTSGIGLGIARALAAQGANIVLNGLGDAGAIERTRMEIEAMHEVGVHYDGADLSMPSAVTGMIERTLSRGGRLDILVNNAGIQHVSPIEDFPPAKWDQILAINLSSVFHAIRAALPAMKSNGFGRIVNVASAHGLVASPFKSAYVAAKHAVLGLTKVVALETAEFDITCNAICPGYVWTPLVEKQIEDQAKAHRISRDEVINTVLLKAQPKKRFATVEEIGALTVFLAGDAGRSITGTALPVDGGWTAQ
ncbi:MAG: 3-hydroxybutyrate dehydrogenase [Alphaproteobacteria bacterium]|nr:3-hydroxybutyrate dehydrogenase [Alphaproteobacteria bacterium]